MTDVRPIDANTALSLIHEYSKCYLTYSRVKCRECDFGKAMRAVEDTPTLDYEPVRHAHIVWKERFRGGFEHNVTVIDDMGISHVGTRDTRHHEKTPYCSSCGRELGESSLNYCPNCGAKMDGIQSK